MAPLYSLIRVESTKTTLPVVDKKAETLQMGNRDTNSDFMAWRGTPFRQAISNKPVPGRSVPRPDPASAAPARPGAGGGECGLRAPRPSGY